MRETITRELREHYAEMERQRRRAWLVIAAGLVALAMIAWAWPVQAAPRREPVPAFVVRVLDGDTVEVAGPLGPEAVRLTRVDCPEIAHRGRPGQPGGEQARAFTASMVLGRWVVVRVHGRDRYGRVLADVDVQGRDLATELVRAGWAWLYRRYSQDATLDALEQQARQAKRGLWGLPSAPVPPWEWRRGKR